MEPTEENKLAPVSTTVVTTALPKERGPQISSKDLNRIKELIEKFPGLEESVSKIQK